jgi:hypothetical protein
MLLAVTLASLGSLYQTRNPHNGMPNPGTPAQVPVDVDCAVRRLAWEYGKHLMPARGKFRTLFDAMQLQFCNVSTPSAVDTYSPPLLPTPRAGKLIFASASAAGDDEAADGSAARPFATLSRAVAAAADVPNSTILVRGGSYFLTEPLRLTAAHSGLTIQNFEGERVEVSGGVNFSLPRSAWKPYKQSVRWETSTGINNVYGQVSAGSDGDGIVYLGSFDDANACEAAAKADGRHRGPFNAWTYHRESFGGAYARQCFGRTDGAWAPVPQANVDSGQLIRQNVWQASLAGVHGLGDGIPGLRVDGRRAIRGKWPNGDPEQSGSFLKGASQGMGGGDYVKGWVPLAAGTQWVPPRRKPNGTDIVITAADWPGVEWPMEEAGGSSWTGEGDWGEYHVGMGGYCDDLDPPYGYWCAMRPPRGQCWDAATNVGSGCVQTHMSPDGVVLPRAANYSRPQTAVLMSWRGGGRWFTQQWQATGFVRENSTLMFDPRTGMQGGEGMTDSGQWWIENVLEEVDDANEYFFDEVTRTLYYNPNSTNDGPTGDEAWVATQLRALVDIRGDKDLPVTDVTIAGLTMRDTRYTYLDPHGMPSGGDWALQRSGAISAEGTERLNISQNELTHLDGVGISLNGYHRHATIERNDFSWIGDSAMAAWGDTSQCLNQNCSKKVPYKVGPDARGGEQPRGTTVERNLVREIGLWQKQSSFWFQALSAESRIIDNVHFNGPRAGINFNDGMGGGDTLSGNLIANCVRESGDHGPFNSWDRVPYITTVKTGKPSIVPAFREISHNFVLATYASQEAIDTDDGSSYYHTHDNFFVYAANGLKSDFGGHHNEHSSNVYVWVNDCWGSGNNDQFVNNTCIANSDSGGFKSDCKKGPLMTVSGNSIYNREGSLGDTKLCDTSNHVAGKWPSAKEVTEMGKRVLGMTSRGTGPPVLQARV